MRGLTDRFRPGVARRLALPCALLLVALVGCAREEAKTVKPALVFGDRGKSDGQFLDIDGIAVDADGCIYVADVHRVQVFDAQGKYLRSIGRPGSGSGEVREEVVGLAINSANQLILADPGNYRYQIFTCQGAFVKSFGGRGTEDGRFIRPQGVCVDGENRIYTVDNGADTVQVFSSEGAFLFRFGRTGRGRGEFREPECIAVHNGRIYVADEGNGRIQYFDLKGTYLGELGRKVGQPPTSSRPDEHADDFGGYYASYFNKDVEGTVFDNDGILYAGNEDEGTVVLFAEKGERLGAFTSEEKGGLKKIQGLAVNREKTRLYVCDEGNMRVQVFDVATIKKAVLRQ